MFYALSRNNSLLILIRLPLLNKATLGHLVLFLRQIAKPENQKYQPWSIKTKQDHKQNIFIFYYLKINVFC